MKIVFFDLETGGITSEAPNIQLAAVVVENGKEIDVLERKIQFDEATATQEALTVNKYSPEDWKNAVTEVQAMQEFAALCRKHSCIERISKNGNPYYVAMGGGHNVAKFDLDRLMSAAKKYNIFLPLSYQTLDTLQAAVWYFTKRPQNQPKDLKLGTLCQHFGIELTNAHEALADVRASIELARKLMGVF